MNKKYVFTLWAFLFILTAALGFGVSAWWKTALSVLFFLPPFVLLYQGDRDTVRLIRNLSALSLGITMMTLILNFVLAVSSETLGNFLHYVLVVVSTPMICSGYWVLSLFLWACLLMVSLKKRNNEYKKTV